MDELKRGYFTVDPSGNIIPPWEDPGADFAWWSDHLKNFGGAVAYSRRHPSTVVIWYKGFASVFVKQDSERDWQHMAIAKILPDEKIAVTTLSEEHSGRLDAVIACFEFAQTKPKVPLHMQDIARTQVATVVHEPEPEPPAAWPPASPALAEYLGFSTVAQMNAALGRDE